MTSASLQAIAGHERWMGWDRQLLEPLLASDPTPARLGEALEALLDSRLPRGDRTNWRLYLYVRDDEADRYELFGVWGAPLSAGTRPDLGEAFDPVEAEARSVLAASNQTEGELFLPLESEEGILGFILFRPISGDVTLTASEEELAFLGRMGGSALARWQRLRRGESTVQRALASATRYLERLLAMTADAVLLVDPDGQILAVNEATEILLQQYALDLVGRPLEAAVPGTAAVAFLAATQLAARQDAPIVRTLRVPNGEVGAREVEATFERVQVDPQSPPGILICLKDLEQARSEDWYRRREARRDRSLAVLTQSLLRPVAALRGYVWVLQDELNQEARPTELCSALDLQAEWLQSRLETIALLDQFRAQAVLWRDQAVSLATLFDRASGRVRSRLVARGIELELPAPDEELRIWVDVEKWVLALSALLDEVAHHLGGPGSILVESRSRRGETGRLLLRIRGRRAERASAKADEFAAIADNFGLTDARSPEGMTLARTVVHHYAGTLLWDWEAEGTAAVTLTLPLVEIARPRQRDAVR
ncbi:MAG: PAS domain-containing protein [Candidatus Eisenbacteria bacterium]